MRDQDASTIDNINIARFTHRNSRYRSQHIAHVYFRGDKAENVPGASLKQPRLDGSDALNISTRIRKDHRHRNRHHRFSRRRKIYGAKIFDAISKGGELKFVTVALVSKLLHFKYFFGRHFNYLLPVLVKKTNFPQIAVLSQHKRHIKLSGGEMHSDK